MRQHHLLCCTLTILAATAITHSTNAQSAVTYAGTQLRRTVDPSERAASGQVILRKDTKTQNVSVTIKGLGEKDFFLYVGEAAQPNTNDLVYIVSPLDQTNVKKGSWMRKLSSGSPTNAPIEFPAADLDLLSGGIIVIAKAGENALITGVTNIVGTVTNIIYGIPVPQPDVTNLVYGTLWAPIPTLMTDPGLLNFSHKDVLTIPTNAPPPSVGAKAKIQTRFVGTKGQSVLDIMATGLTRGQTYTVFIANTNDTSAVPYVLIPAGEMTAAKGSSGKFQFTRDTKYGDPLPQQARDIGDLLGRAIEIRDAGNFVHLEGTIP